MLEAEIGYLLDAIREYLLDIITGYLLQIAIGIVMVVILGRLFINLPMWRFRRKKAIKENEFIYFLSGYYMFRSDDNPNMFIISDGIWGINTTHLVFAHRSTPETLDKAIEISEVKSLEVFDYDVSERIFEENKNADVLVHGVDNAPKLPPPKSTVFKTEEVFVNAIKNPIANSVLAMSKKENVCRITCLNGAESFFYYKNTRRNAESINNIRRNAYK